MANAITSVSMAREPRLLGQTVVVIGGSAGIGFETARLARIEGADLVLTARDPKRLEAVACEVAARSTVAFDADDAVGVKRFFEELRATLPIRRVVEPADIAALAVHLMTNTAITGATYDVDGGQRLID
jgi:NAD(P)-dependent dehydrogenase (short-subunit alcohol dehydrogenase family)